MKPSTRRLLKRWSAFAAVSVVLFVLLSNRWVINSTDAYVFRNWALLPEQPNFPIVPGPPVQVPPRGTEAFPTTRPYVVTDVPHRAT